MSDKEVLSQDEVDALLEGVDSGAIDLSDGDGDVEASPFDFTNRDHIARVRMPMLEMINERYIRNFRLSISSLLQKNIEAYTESVQIITFAEFMSNLQEPSSLNLVQAKPLRGTALFVLDPKLVSGMVEVIYGGTGKYDNSIVGREFSATESRMIDKFLGKAYHDLKQAWSSILPINFEYIRTELHPHMINVAASTDAVVVNNYVVDFEEDKGLFSVMMPYSMLEPIRDLLSDEAHNDQNQTDEFWSKALREEVLDAGIEVRSTLAHTQVSLREVMEMKAGDVIPFEMPEHVRMYAEGIPTFKAKFGVSNNSCALKIIGRIARS